MKIAWQVQDVAPVVKEVEQLVHERQCHAAAFISYEAAPGFDKSLATKSTHDVGSP